MSKTDINSHFSHVLTSFGESLKCSEQYRDEGAHLAQQVFLKLQAKSKYSISEVRFGGSFGKKTDVLYPDLDLVVVMNDVLPPYDKILDDFEDIFLLYDKELKIRPGFKRKYRALHFYFTNGIEVDLLPAASLSIPEVHAEIQKNPYNFGLYDSSTVQKQISFLTSQSGFTHTLIRLAKYWLKSLHLVKKLNAGSAIMEMICVYVASVEESNNQDGRSMLRAFIRFIDTVCKLSSLKLTFREVEEDKWEHVPFNELQVQDYARRRDFIPKVVGTEEIFRQSCFIIPPGNPFNDFLSPNVELIGKLQEYAAATRKRLQDILHPNIGPEDFISILFEPMPQLLVIVWPLAIPHEFQIKYSTPCTSRFGDLKVRNEKVYSSYEVRRVIEALRWDLQLAVKNVTTPKNDQKVTTNDVVKTVDAIVGTALNKTLVPALVDKEESMDVTLSIPYTIDGKMYAVKFSMKWS